MPADMAFEPPTTADPVADLLNELNTISQEFNHLYFGLPIGHRATFALMRQAVSRYWLRLAQAHATEAR